MRTYKMSATFSIGTLSPKEKRQKRKRNQVKGKTSGSVEPAQSWLIVPCDLQTSFSIHLLNGNSYLSKKEDLPTYDKFVGKSNSKFAAYCRSQKEKCRDILELNQKIRWVLKHFLTSWLVKRFKKINQTDFVTLSPIQKPVSFNHFPSRSCYTFEADSIFKDIHKKLLHHDGQIPSPLYPRNPFTNKEFQTSELLHLYLQCKQLGKTSWAFETFLKANMSTVKFAEYQRKPLRIHAIRSILYQYSSWEGIELLLNFIECHHEEHEADFKKRLYTWCLVHIPEEARIVKWRRLCFEYYESEILADDAGERDLIFFRTKAKSGSLCCPPHDLLAKMKLIQSSS